MDIENAIHSFSKAIENRQNVAEALLQRAKAYLIQGECEKAAEDYNKALELDPEYVIKKLEINTLKESNHIDIFGFTEQNNYE